LPAANRDFAGFTFDKQRIDKYRQIANRQENVAFLAPTSCKALSFACHSPMQQCRTEISQKQVSNIVFMSGIPPAALAQPSMDDLLP
jgi:hypothetical protein